ncbi:MAG: HAMP domain-containing sensor histidine kinase [Bacteroidetes bacterium]|nr:HAMP domain-containing sensor histidine kinase [Bacteroidota bacterium]
MSQRKILTGIAIFIASYMIAALGWWTFSLLKYSETEFLMEQKILSSEQRICIEDIATEFDVEYHHENKYFLSKVVPKNEFKLFNEKITLFVNNNYHDFKTMITYDTSKNVATVQISIKPEVLKSLDQRSDLKSKAWLGEGFVIGLITLIIILAMYIYIDQILRFNLQKTNFMMAVTHELKTPIAAAKLAIETVIRNKNIEAQDRVLEISKKNIDRLSGMMERVLLATQFENSLPIAQKKWESCSDIIQKALVDCQFTDEQILKISLVIPSNFSIYCDSNMMKIAFINLFTNSIKYSEPNGVNVIVSSIINNVQCQILISDQGIGIPMIERTRIFEKFYRVGNEKTRSRSGSGLGLYLVKQILQLHDARIEVQANNPKGSTFVINFNASDFRME